MLPYLEQNQFYQSFTTLLPNVTNPTGNGLTNSTQTLNVSVLVCPSQSPSGTPAPLTYVVNCGRADSTAPVANTPTDWQENGVFFDQFTPVITPSIPRVTTDLSYISKHDGTPQTIMFSENLDALDWTSTLVPSNPPAAPFLVLAPNFQAWWQGLIWFPTLTPNVRLNKIATTGRAAIVASATPDEFARPSSNHPGGFLVTYCDGHSSFMGEDTEYRVRNCCTFHNGSCANKRSAVRSCRCRG